MASRKIVRPKTVAAASKPAKAKRGKDWFANMSKKEQQAYIKEHPKSKYAKNAAAAPAPANEKRARKKPVVVEFTPSKHPKKLKTPALDKRDAKIKEQNFVGPKAKKSEKTVEFTPAKGRRKPLKTPALDKLKKKKDAANFVGPQAKKTKAPSKSGGPTVNFKPAGKLKKVVNG